MPTRRQTLSGVTVLALGSAAATVGAFSSSADATADMRVVVETDLDIIPARDDQAYVETDPDGLVDAFVFQELNERAITEFEDIAEIVNNGDTDVDHFELEFIATDADGNPLGPVADILRILPKSPTGPPSDGVYTLLENDGALAPGDGVVFGIEVNLLPGSAPGAIADLPDENFSVRLEITAAFE